MKCISEALIQKYIDKETTALEQEYINKHLAGCPQCAEQIEEMRKKATQFKQWVGLIDEENIEIPSFVRPASQHRFLHPSTRQLIYGLSAACILVLFLLISPKKEEKVELVYSYDLESEFNANLPISEQDMEFKITDSEGKLIQY